MCDLIGKYSEWQKWLFGDDIHSIQKQILAMIWDSAIFQSVNEARSYAPVDAENNPELNGMVQGFINHCFFQTQALAIRRLLDSEQSTGEREVYSLSRLILDVERNRRFVTRKNILAALDYPYEYEEGLREFRRRVVNREQPGDLVDCKYSETMHKAVDALSGVQPDRRSAEDCIHEKVLVWLKKRLESCRQIGLYVNKFVAHAATPESRAAINARGVKVTLGSLYEAHSIICETTQFIGLALFNHSMGNFLVSCAYDQFEHFEKPWATEETMTKLRDFWRQYDKATHDWNNWDWEEELKKSFGNT